jgi:transcriptional regulator with XRE-family HTH domain
LFFDNHYWFLANKCAPSFTLMEHIGLKVKLARISKGLSQLDLAQKIGKTRSLVSHVEQTGRVSLNTLIEMSKALGIPTEELGVVGEKDGLSRSEYVINSLTQKLNEMEVELKLEREKYELLHRLYESQLEVIGLLKEKGGSSRHSSAEG